MPHTSRRVRHTAARITTAAAAAALLAAGATGLATAQSSDAVAPGHDATATHSTTTHGNLTITHEVIGPNIGFYGDEIHYRTTISATEGPARQVTAINQLNENGGCTGHDWTVPISGTVTYTNQAGARVTDSTSLYDGAAGSWTVDRTTDSTVVYDTVYEFYNPSLGIGTGCGRMADPETRADTGEAGERGLNLDAALRVEADGLDTLYWSPTGVTVSCALSCDFLFPASLFFGS
ncbi:hypothetical protein [Rhodococcus gannanensis]|uniref:Uncharacterized protein n=1 Tax=Rhodococcus gannanensis TaxID=1960308 RepID=A0ABW4P4G9_9NOCA